MIAITGKWLLDSCLFVTVKRPSEQETALDFFPLLPFFPFGTSSAKGGEHICQYDESWIPLRPSNKPPWWLAARRAQVPSQQRVTRSNTCDCTASYLNKRVSCLGRRASAAGRVRKCGKNNEEKQTRDPRARELQLPNRTKRHATHKCSTLSNAFFSLLLFPRMTPLWRTYNKKGSFDGCLTSLVQAGSPLHWVNRVSGKADNLYFKYLKKNPKGEARSRCLSPRPHD